LHGFWNFKTHLILDQSPFFQNFQPGIGLRQLEKRDMLNNTSPNSRGFVREQQERLAATSQLNDIHASS
jgi:hypothetical protein